MKKLTGIPAAKRVAVWNVLFPALIPLLLLLLLRQWGGLRDQSALLSIGLLLAAAGIFQRRLSAHWGPVFDLSTETRRFARLIWLLLILLPLYLLFLLTISVYPLGDGRRWTYLLSGGVSFFIYLLLIFQILRFSPGAFHRRIRSVFGLLVLIFVTFSGWNPAIQILIFFFLTVWLAGFEECDTLTTRARIKLAAFCALGLIFVAVFAPDGSVLTIEGVNASPRLLESLRYLQRSLVPFLPEAVGGARRLLLALLIVLPGKVILRPIGEWLKYSLRIRTKLLLSYLFSSIIPGIILILILLFGMYVILGSYWQSIMEGLIRNEAEYLQKFETDIPQGASKSSTTEENDRFRYLRAAGITCITGSALPGGGLGKLRISGAELPGFWESEELSAPWSFPLNETGAQDTVAFTVRTRFLQDARGTRSDTAGIPSDSLFIRLCNEHYRGLCWISEAPYLITCERAADQVAGWIKPVTLPDLIKLKNLIGVDLSILSGRGTGIDRSNPDGLSVQFGKNLRTVLSTTGSAAQRTGLDLPLRFLTLIPSPVLSPDGGLDESYTIIVIATSLRSLLSRLWATEQSVSRIYLGVFIALALFFGAILILIALIGFSLAGGITRTVGQLHLGTQQLRKGDLSAHIEIKSRDELGELADSFNLMVDDLNRMLDEVKEKERLQGELEAAKSIQLQLLPQSLPSIPGYEISAASLPAAQVGGDYYDFLSLADGVIGLAVGDVSGKGMPAALLMANLQASLRTLVQTIHPPDELVTGLNRVLHNNTAPNMFATFFFGILDAPRGVLRYVNAGHNAPVICGDDRLLYLREGGLPLGVLSDAEYQIGEIQLVNGELIALYSDGIVEAMNSDETEFGEERLIRLLQRHSGDTAEEILQAVIREVETFCGTPQDDVTLMIIKRL
jgi:serine phosphatase RsbU (regulator of sigma subunit)